MVVLAALAVLGVWLHAGGLLGHAIAYVARGLFGAAAVTVPVLSLYWGVLLLRGTAEDDRARMAIGFGLMVVGALAIVSVVRGDPVPTSGYTGVHVAGGLVGAVLGWPLAHVASTVGAVIICLGLVTLGALIFTGTPLAAVWHAIRPRRQNADAGEAGEEIEQAG